MRNDCWASPEEEKGMTQLSVYTWETLCSLPPACVAGSPWSKDRNPAWNIKKTDDIIREQFEVTGRTRKGETEQKLRHQVKSVEMFRREVSVCLVSWHNISLVSMRSTEVAACTDTMVTAGILGRSNMSLASRTHINTPGSNRGGLWN